MGKGREGKGRGEKVRGGVREREREREIQLATYESIFFSVTLSHRFGSSLAGGKSSLNTR